jgi:hypothetical protein
MCYLCVQKVLPFEMLLLEGQDGQTWKYHVCNCAPCHLFTKAKVCKGVSQEGSLGVTFHASRSVGECEGMNLHTPK